MNNDHTKINIAHLREIPDDFVPNTLRFFKKYA